jgi:CubicO group peptidase (beta-lactamase class C family)
MSLRSEQISAFLQERINAGDFPSAVYLVAEKGEIVFQDALGYAVVEPERIPATLDTIYDLASLTKPLVTGLLAARLIEKSVVSTSDQVERILVADPASARTDHDLISLATHVSGYPAWIPFYVLPGAPRLDPEDYGCHSESNDAIRNFVTQSIITMATSPNPDREVVYSDLNFHLIGSLLEEMSGLPLSTLFLTEIVDRLALQRTGFWGPSEKQKSAASETGNEYERQMCKEKFPEIRIPQSAIRNGLIWGEVHDGNAFFMGGVAGHAGLFSTAEEVFKIAQQFLPNHTRLLKPETCELFRTNFTKGMNEDRSLAFQLASTKDSTAGSRMSPESFGHTGFTGTSLWIDPVKDRIFVLLTNRTHMHPLPFVNINSVRRRFHELSIELLENKASN